MTTDGPAPKTLVYGPDRTIFSQGDRSQEIYIITSGKVEIYREHGHGKVTLATLGEGEIFGTLTSLTQKERTASAKALMETKLTVIPKGQVGHMKLPKWVRVFVKDLTNRLIEMNERYAKLVLHMQQQGVNLPADEANQDDPQA